MPRVVTLGGGTGQAVVLDALVGLPCCVTAIVSVTDNGGHSGELRRAFGIPQVGDARNCLSRLIGPEARELLDFRFARGPLAGAQLGNLLVASLLLRGWSLTETLLRLRKAFGAHATVLPVSDGNSHICAVLEGAKRIRGEWEILERRPRRPIVRLYHDPPLSATAEAREAIREADLVVFCPGSLRTGLVSCLLAQGISASLKGSRALKLYVANLLTQPGQTDGFSLLDHLREIERYARITVDGVIANSARIPEQLLRRYRRLRAEPVWVGPLPPTVAATFADLVERPTAQKLRSYQRPGRTNRQLPHWVRHDPARLQRALAPWIKLASRQSYLPLASLAMSAYRRARPAASISSASLT